MSDATTRAIPDLFARNERLVAMFDTDAGPMAMVLVGAIMIILGVIGWILNRYGFSPSPIVLGLILGSIAEQGFLQGAALL